MYKIFCDETWTASYIKCNFPCYVFYGVMLEEEDEPEILNEIDEFKKTRGLYKDNSPIEIKWVKVEEEWKNAIKRKKESRYEEFLEIFFKYLKCKKISFAYMYLAKQEYDRVEKNFLTKQPDNQHNFFFMLYFQFLYHTFIKNQVKQNPCQIFIDDHDIGAEGRSYDISTLREVINRRLFRDFSPRFQNYLHPAFEKKILNSILFVDLQDSKQYPLIQLSDLCAGCVRQILENRIPPPRAIEYLPLFQEENIYFKPTNGKEELALSFYQRLRGIKEYQTIDLMKTSYYYRFCIFPFSFKQR